MFLNSSSGEAAARAVNCGVAAVMVSNHGGRRMDGLPATVCDTPWRIDTMKWYWPKKSLYNIFSGLKSATDTDFTLWNSQMAQISKKYLRREIHLPRPHVDLIISIGWAYWPNLHCRIIVTQFLMNVMWQGHCNNSFSSPTPTALQTPFLRGCSQSCSSLQMYRGVGP